MAEGRQRLISDYAGRGQLYGGSLTGAQARFESGLGEEYLASQSKILNDIISYLTQQDVNLGFQRSSQAQQLIDALIRQYIGGQFGILGAEAGKQKRGFGFSIGLPGGAGIGINT